MSPLMCARCGKQIIPGATVEFIGPEDYCQIEGNFIVTDGDTVVVHLTCP